MKLVKPHPNERDSEQVRALVSLGATSRFIADHLDLTEEELSAHYRLDLELGQEEANLNVARTLYQMATSGQHPQATMAWLKMRARWSDATPDTPSSEEEEELRQQAKDKLLTLLNRGQNADASKA